MQTVKIGFIPSTWESWDGSAYTGKLAEKMRERCLNVMKTIPGWEIVVPCAIANGSMGYFPNNSAYDEGGYETRASSYKRGVADVLVNESAAMLNELKERI